MDIVTVLLILIVVLQQVEIGILEKMIKKINNPDVEELLNGKGR